MGKKSKITHSRTFCSQSHPIIQRLAKEFSHKDAKERTIKIQLFDELEMLEAESNQNCDCKKAISIIVEAANLNKWMGLLFSQHQRKFNKYSIRIPAQYEQLKFQITQIIGKLQQKFIFTISQNNETRANKQKKKLKAKTKLIGKAKNIKLQTYQAVKLQPQIFGLIKFQYKNEDKL